MGIEKNRQQKKTDENRTAVFYSSSVHSFFALKVVVFIVVFDPHACIPAKLTHYNIMIMMIIIIVIISSSNNINIFNNYHHCYYYY